MKIYYIAGPYRAPTVRQIVLNIRAAEQVALSYWRRGDCAVICPHLNSALLDGAVPDHVWLDGDMEIIRRCDAVVMMRTWQSSTGAKAEHALALELGKEVIYE